MAVRTYGNIRFEGKRWYLKLEPHVNIRFKDMFRKVNSSAVGTIFIGDSNPVRRDIQWFLTRYPLEISQRDAGLLNDGAEAFEQSQRDLEKIFLPDAKFQSMELVKQPRDYQHVAIQLVTQSGALLCADATGLGKTLVGIGSIVKRGQYPAIVLCQTHLPAQWVEKFQEFAPYLKCHVVKSRKMYDLPQADVYIMPYSRMSGWADIITTGHFKTVVYDEIQELRRQDSQKYETATQLTRAASLVLGLSATPVYNYGGEIFAVMNVIKPGCLGEWHEFSREWCEFSFDENKAKVRDPKALGTYLRENHLMIRRTRKQVKRELPAVNKVIHAVEYDAKLAESASAELETIAAKVVSGSFTERGLAARELDVRARQLTGVAKAASVADYVRVLLENDESVLLVGWHRECYDIWLKRLADYSPVMYTGSESPTQKEAARKKFMSRESKLMIMSLRSGVGLDGLQEVCDLVIFAEMDWAPGVHEQVIGRLNRDGQDSQVTAIYLTTDNGTDPLMLDLLGVKAAQAHGIVNATDEVEFQQSDDSRIKRLAESILSRKKT